MKRLLPRRASAVASVAAIAVGGAAGSVVVSTAVTSTAAAASTSVAASTAAARPPVRLPKVIVPDLFAVTSRGITAAQLTRLTRLRYVRSVIAVDGGSVKIGGHAVAVIGVNAQAFRAWTPAPTAARQDAWTALGRDELVTTAAAATRLGLRGGRSYRVSGVRQPVVKFGGTAAIGIPGVDAVVSAWTSRDLGLVPQIGVLISAPRVSLAKLDAQIRGVIGSQTRIVSLRPAQQVTVPQTSLPIGGASAGQPTNYLALFRDSAAKYCPGLSWTVLAAIGQIESADGQNMGPSSAGALGPMQFLPSTWARWGIDGFGPAGPPDIMNPLDAVPAAAEYLCAGGAAHTASLPAAIFSYNHAAWYVAEVLALALRYAQVYG